MALARGLGRDGPDVARRLRGWKQIEAAHFAREDTRQRADLLVDGDPAQPLAYDPELAFTVS